MRFFLFWRDSQSRVFATMSFAARALESMHDVACEKFLKAAAGFVIMPRKATWTEEEVKFHRKQKARLLREEADSLRKLATDTQAAGGVVHPKIGALLKQFAADIDAADKLVGADRLSAVPEQFTSLASPSTYDHDEDDNDLDEDGGAVVDGVFATEEDDVGAMSLATLSRDLFQFHENEVVQEALAHNVDLTACVRARALLYCVVCVYSLTFTVACVRACVRAGRRTPPTTHPF